MTDGVFIIVPAYNEEKVIQTTLEELLDSFSNIIVVNDGSSDRTLSILNDLNVSVINHLINIGQGSALQSGITYALSMDARIIVTFDSDGQHKVSDVVDMVREMGKGDCDVMLGSRFLGNTEGMSKGRELLLKAAITFSNLTSRIKLTDAHNGLRVMNRKAANCLNITQHGMAHASEVTQQFHNAGMRIAEHPVTIRYTEYSMSKGQQSLNAFNIILDLIIGRFFR